MSKLTKSSFFSTSTKNNLVSCDQYLNEIVSLLLHFIRGQKQKHLKQKLTNILLIDLAAKKT